MGEFMQDCVKQYLRLANVPETSLRPVATPFLEDSKDDSGSHRATLDDRKVGNTVEESPKPGVLQSIACKVLMKI